MQFPIRVISQTIDEAQSCERTPSVDTGGDIPLQHTFGHIDCPACEATRTDTLGNDPDSLLKLDFATAVEKWLSTRKPYLKERSFYMAEQHIHQLNRFFAATKASQIHIGHLRQYQRARACNENKTWARTAGPSIINHELSVMQQFLKRCGRWKDFAEHYEPLPLPPSKKPKVMTADEEYRLFQIAKTSPDFELAYLVASISVNTTACGSELRHLRLEHISLEGNPKFTINPEHTKNEFRSRTIPLNATAAEQMKQCVARARSLGSFLPEHYLFPKRVTRNLWDPYKPASTSWLRTSFAALREAADLPWLTPHCLRHQSVTKLLELGVAPEVVKSISGHISDQMMRHYCHTRFSASLDALSRIDSGSVRPDGKIRGARA
jgi:integrase